MSKASASRAVPGRRRRRVRQPRRHHPGPGGRGGRVLVTSKRQVTIPKSLADRYGIAAGDEIRWREAEDLLRQFEVLHPDDRVVRVALQGMAAYGLSLWNAHMWAHAEVHELGVLYSEDFQHERWYGGVVVVDPFR